MQDFAAWAWWTHVVTRLGLPNVFHTMGNDFRDPVPLQPEVRWTQDLGYTPEMLRSAAGRFQATFREGTVECAQGDVEEVEETTDVVQSVSGWVAAGLALATVLTGGVVGIGAAGIAATVWGAATLVEEGYDLLTEPTDYADLSFVIDAPLVPGANVVHCCVHNRPIGCSDVATTPCWPTDPPSTRYVSCCGTVESTEGVDEVTSASAVVGTQLLSLRAG